ncbi:MAG: biopolymer transporter ExbD [Deltaproteobacteria bacterium]|nr:biopolymer transporter ExbD [Deltaproteobacteria bacterium]
MAADVQANGDSEDDAIAQINIIPFVDIVLVLLIIFMLTSAAIVKASLKVELPKAASAGDGVESTLNIVLTKEDLLYLNGEVTTAEALAGFVRGEAAKNPQLQAVIAADKIAAYGKVIAIIDLVKQNGVKAFALNLERDLAAAATKL